MREQTRQALFLSCQTRIDRMDTMPAQTSRAQPDEPTHALQKHPRSIASWMMITPVKTNFAVMMRCELS